MERETGIEPAPSAWKAEVLPLNYSRLVESAFAEIVWWREVDSNHRRRKPADLQSAPVGRLGIPPTKNGYYVDQARSRQHPGGKKFTFSRVFFCHGSVDQKPSATCASTSCSISLDSVISFMACSCSWRS